MKNLIQIKEPKEISNLQVKGYDFNEGLNYDKLFSHLKTMGIQSTQLALAID